MHKVMKVSYRELVQRMIAAGLDGMGQVLIGQLDELGQPETKNEVRYFWAAFHNAVLETEDQSVWLWLVNSPHVRHFATNCGGPMELPEIGGPDDEPYVPTEGLKQWAAEPTEQNFIEQAAAFDNLLEEAGKENPENQCKTIAEYVSTWWHSSTGRMEAHVELVEGGFHALATQQGLDWLMATYPPLGEMAHI